MSEKRIGPVQGQGSSMAGEETAEILPEMNLAFDVGRAPRELISIDHVFLTHGHMDHSAGLAYYFSQRNFVGNAPGCVIAPNALVQPIRALMPAWARIEGHAPPKKLVGLPRGECRELRPGFTPRAFDVNPRV